MACANCGQAQMVTATIGGAEAATSGEQGCRVCSATRFALLWIFGVGTAGTALVYWLFGPFTGCAC
jgi:hypothetical protein